MSDADSRPGCCSACGLPIRGHEHLAWPGCGFHAAPDVCILRLREELDAANRERAAANRVALRLRGELDKREVDLAAALRVVLAARVLRVRAWQCDRAARRLNRAPGDERDYAIRAYDAAYTAGRDAARAHRAALAAYVKGEGR